MSQYGQFFERLCSDKRPYEWQLRLGEDADIRNRLISIPTGFGKTLGVAAAWLYQRVVLKNAHWSRRLVWCLPMRTLVEQTAETLRQIVSSHDMDVDVHVLMGGISTKDYHLEPEKNAILVGTQDMLLSRALNRGYGVARARWPMDFSLLNNDCLWVLDEVQLMDVGLATSAQLQQFRNEVTQKMCRPCYSWWMSATLQPSWLKSVDSVQMVEFLESDILKLSESDQHQSIWRETDKPLALENFMDDKLLTDYILSMYLQHLNDEKTILVVVNTVKRATNLYEQIIKKDKSLARKIRLIHSQFRGFERNQWRETFLSRENFGHQKLVIATQVVEAGVDISADILVTELAPWSSLIQRFGRCARYGGHGEIHVIDIDTSKATNALPYDIDELNAARDLAVKKLEDASLYHLDLLDASLKPDDVQALYPYEPQHLLMRHEIGELFDTTADLTGADLDISRYIRTGDDRNCSVFWRDLDSVKDISELNHIQPNRVELCSVPVYAINNFKDGFLKKAKEKKKDLKSTSFIWNYLDNCWEPLNSPIQPGRIVLLNQKVGGYSSERGFTGDPSDVVAPIPQLDHSSTPADVQADSGQDADNLSMTECYQTIAVHDAEAINWGKYFSQKLSLPDDISRILLLALSLHDYGKCHPEFQSMIKENANCNYAKAPKDKWQPPKHKWIRHEFASALGIIEILAQTNRMHPALLGDWQDYIDLGVIKPIESEGQSSEIGLLLNELSRDEFNLLIYLVAAHHGKVRAALHATPADQKGLREIAKEKYDMPIRGIYENDILPTIDIILPDNENIQTPAVELHLDIANMGLSNRYGASWSERVHQIIEKYGPYQLAWFESLVRVADIQASKGLSVPSTIE